MLVAYFWRTFGRFGYSVRLELVDRQKRINGKSVLVGLIGLINSSLAVCLYMDGRRAVDKVVWSCG